MSAPDDWKNVMRKSKKYWISLTAAVMLTAFIVVCRFCTPLADFYSLHLYPVISAVLSWISSPLNISFQGIAVVAIIIGFIYVLVRSCRKHEGWKKCLAAVANLLLWTFVWFYMGWCLNYSRSSIFQRLAMQRTPFDSVQFAGFLTTFTENLNASFVDDKTVDADLLESEIKSFYASVPAKYGLCKPRSWQHPKRMMPEWYHSATGILGYMGPLFSEFHINTRLLPEQLPFNWAREYAHVLGVSSEDEANWWAWNACVSSEVPAISYSAHLSMLSHVWVNARRLLSESEFKTWQSTISEEVMQDFIAKNDYWRSLRSPSLDRIQNVIYDLFLKGNHIPSGIKNYSEVVQMMMNIDYGKASE